MSEKEKEKERNKMNELDFSFVHVIAHCILKEPYKVYKRGILSRWAAFFNLAIRSRTSLLLSFFYSHIMLYQIYCILKKIKNKFYLQRTKKKKNEEEEEEQQKL